MENYEKGDSRKIFDPPNLHLDGAIEMKVTAGSKIRNLMGFALSSMSDYWIIETNAWACLNPASKDSSEGAAIMVSGLILFQHCQSVREKKKLTSAGFKGLYKLMKNGIRHITWNATGNAIHKAVTCAEIVKRKIKGLHQITQIGYMRIEDDWIPKLEGLDELKVYTNVPAISILLSKDQLDATNPSYQAPNVEGIHWAGSSDKRPQQTKSHKNAAAVRNLKSAASKPKRSKAEHRKDFNKKATGKKQAETEQGQKEER